MEKIVDFLVAGTSQTRTGGMIGLEVETDFVDLDGRAISVEVTQKLLEATGKPVFCELKLELGRQKLELNIQPEPSFELVYDKTQEALKWLYAQAESLGARPIIPYEGGDEPLLYVQEERDELWVGIDGEPALEHLCRCSSVQFVIDVNSGDAIEWLNKLAQLDLESTGYTWNDRCWKSYIESSQANYLPDRYGGPGKFNDLRDYVDKLCRHHVVMHRGCPTWRHPSEVDDLDVNLFLRSVWWHARLRRYGDSLTIEIRPLGRCADESIPTLWNQIESCINA